MVALSCRTARCALKGRSFKQSSTSTNASGTTNTIRNTLRISSPSVAVHKRVSSSSSIVANPDFVDLRLAPMDFDASSAVVYPDFITVEQAKGLQNDILATMKRKRYQKGHWDAVIVKYKETELLDEAYQLSEASQSILQHIRDHLEQSHLQHKDNANNLRWLPCHAIDLHPQGELRAHVDSVRFSGDMVAGLSLMSSAIMRLLPDNDDDDDGSSGDENDDNNNSHPTDRTSTHGFVDLYLPPQSLYVLSGPGRYSYSHQLLPSGSIFYQDTSDGSSNHSKNVMVERDHRLSVIFRDAKTEP